MCSALFIHCHVFLGHIVSHLITVTLVVHGQFDLYLFSLLGECSCVATEHKQFVKMSAHNDYSKKNNT
jgi:hypothetical protein